jgi:hypothetical protein
MRRRFKGNLFSGIIRGIPESIPITLAFVIILSNPMGILMTTGECEPESITRDAPEGYYEMSDALSDYPGLVVENGTSYDILSDLSLPASRPLYLGPGSLLRFSEGVYLNLSAAPFFQGGGDPIHLLPINQNRTWGGINLFEADPTTTPTMEDIRISGARIGIRTRGESDLKIANSKISNCTRSGIEVSGPTSAGTMIDISNTSLSSCGVYGIHLSEIEESDLDNIQVTDCITGIRSFGSSLNLRNSNISNCDSLGISFVDSGGKIMSSIISEFGVSSTSVTHQLISLNSTIEISNSRISGGKECILLQRDSYFTMTASEVSDGFKDCIQSIGAELVLRDVHIEKGIESAIHLEDSVFEGEDLTLENNGRGTGDVVYSTFYMNGARAKLESSTITGSGDAHFHLNSSSILIANSTLGNFGNDPIILQSASHAEYVNMIPPPDPWIKDILSFTRYSITPSARILDYSTGKPLSGVQVDIIDREGRTMDSSITDGDGISGPFFLRLFTNHTTGTMSNLPIRFLASMEDYEVSELEFFSPPDSVEMVLYPPNDPPTLNLISPVNGTTSDGTIAIEGYITDDLGIFKVRYRVDQGSFTEMNITLDGDGGYFKSDIQIGSISKGEHRLWIHAFDGSHLSAPSIRTFFSNGSGMDDSDMDGIPDMVEDSNGNGIVDQGETDPNDPDSDSDGLLDGIEIDDSDGNTTDPLDADSDGDFILDGTEDSNGNGRLDANETDPNDEDTDGDGRTDLEDRYPLDPERWDQPDEGNSDSSIILVLVVIIAVLVLILGYALYQRISTGGISGAGKDVDPEEKHRNPAGLRNPENSSGRRDKTGKK